MINFGTICVYELIINCIVETVCKFEPLHLNVDN